MDVSNLQKSPHIGHSGDSDEKYMSGLSTILVATIQETKDRISQIEYIFCSQLYPIFQKNTKCIQKLCAEARKAVECEWQEKESQLRLQMKEVYHEKEQAIEDCKSLEAEKSKFLKRVLQLEEQLMQKSKEVDEGMELHGKLLQLLESKESMIRSKEKQQKEDEERINFLLAKLDSFEKKICALEAELHERNEEISKEKVFQAELLRQIELQALKSEERLHNDKTEKKQLAVQLEHMKASLDILKEDLRQKTSEVEEAKKLQECLVEQIKLHETELTKKDHQVSEHEQDRKLLLLRLNDLEHKIEELQENPGKQESSEFCTNLLQQIESKTSELSSEKQKNIDLLAAYKRLKSQYNYLLEKSGLTEENMLPRRIKMEDESDPSSNHHRNINSPELRNQIPVSNMVGEISKINKEFNSGEENSTDERAARLTKTSDSHSSRSHNCPAAQKYTTDAKSGQPSAVKRHASNWRHTRSFQGPGGPDPHDDFLDTPYENIRGNLENSIKERVHDFPAPVAKEMNCDSSDDETQDMGAEPSPKKQQLQVPRPDPRGFKYVEPVRKKTERENLKGVECKQCKKFYDAVLPDGRDRDAEGSKGKIRCEHHDGVSRHRYRYVPASTPEGFWNIGFDSEI
ncbi:hypothetical protein Ancab_035019 [Ancistrocladus abbreviatus]